MRRPLAFAALAVLALSSFTTLRAQEESPPLESGQRVRVDAGGTVPLVGTIVSVDSEMLVLLVEEGPDAVVGSTLEIPRSAIRELTVIAPPESGELHIPLGVGDTVRITAPDLGIEKQQATFQALHGDTLVVTADSTVYCPLGSVTRFDVYRGRKSTVGKNALWGGVIGGALGLGLSIAIAADCDDCLRSDAWAILTAMGGGIGAGIGAGIGLISSRTDRWEEVPLDQLRVSFVPRREGFALGLSVAF